MIIQATTGDALAFYTAVDHIARILAAEGDTESIDVRRSKATGILANPFCAVQLLLKHAAPSADSDVDPSADPDPDTDTDGQSNATDTADPDGHSVAPDAAIADHPRPTGGPEDSDVTRCSPPWPAPPGEPPGAPPREPREGPGPYPLDPAPPPNSGPPPEPGPPPDAPPPRPPEDEPPAPPAAPPPDSLSPWDLHPDDDDSDDPLDDPLSRGAGGELCPHSAGAGPTGAGPIGARGAGIRPDSPEQKAVATALVAALEAGRIDLDRLLPQHTLYLHVSSHAVHHASHGCAPGCEQCADCASGQPVPPVARVEATGPAGRLLGPRLLDQVTELLGHARVDLKPVLDPTDPRSVDGYEVPDWMAEAKQLRIPGSVFPYSPCTSRQMDRDHTRAYQRTKDGKPAEPGQTRLANLGLMERSAHRVKTHGRGWWHGQPRPGVYLWRTPHGWWFLLDHTGTHRLGQHPDLSGYGITDPDHPDNGEADPADGPDSPAQ